MTAISVIVGSTREGRFSEKPAKWILQLLKKRERVDARLLDLRDFPMPFFDQAATPATPGRPAFAHEVVQKWTAAIARPDSLVGPHPRRHPVGSLPRRRCRRWIGWAGGARRDADRRSAVVDRRLEDGARKRVLIATTWRRLHCRNNFHSNPDVPCLSQMTTPSQTQVIAQHIATDSYQEYTMTMFLEKVPYTGKARTTLA
jgi:NADPH-dependent FMN reductase